MLSIKPKPPLIPDFTTMTGFYTVLMVPRWYKPGNRRLFSNKFKEKEYENIIYIDSSPYGCPLCRATSHGLQESRR